MGKRDREAEAEEEEEAGLCARFPRPGGACEP